MMESASSPGKRRTTHHSSFKPADSKKQQQLNQAAQVMGVSPDKEKEEEEMKLPDTSLLDIS